MAQVMSLMQLEPQVWTGFSDAHHCELWAAVRDPQDDGQRSEYMPRSAQPIRCVSARWRDSLMRKP